MEQALAYLSNMHGTRVKRGRTEVDSRPTLQAWVRLVLKIIMIMNKAICHKVHMKLKMPGPYGLMTRQIPGDGRALGRQAAGEGDVGPHRRMAQSRSHEAAEQFQVSNAFRLVSGDRKGSSTDSNKTHQNGDINICPDPGDTGKSSSQHVGHPEGSRCEQGDAHVLMQQALHSVGLEDREESGPTFLEVQPATNPTMCIPFDG